MALTARYASTLNTQWIQRIVEQNSTLTESDRATLKSALELYKIATDATCTALAPHGLSSRKAQSEVKRNANEREI